MSGWSTSSAPFSPEQTVMPVAPEPEPEPVEASSTATEEADEAAQHRARARGPRRATESFAEALARAEDPSAPELPRSEEVAEALAALHHEPVDTADAILPRELPAADEVPVAEEVSAPDEEPAPEVADAPQMADAPEGADAPEEADEAAGQVADQVPEPAEAEAPVEAIAEEAEQPIEADAAAETSVEPASASIPEPPSWDESRYTSTIDEPDWLEAEAIEQPAPSDVEAPPEEQAVAGADTSEFQEVEPPAESSEPEVLPGSSELSEALAALDAIGSEPEPGPASEMEKQPEPEPEPASEAEPEPDAGNAIGEWPPVSPAPDPGPPPRPSPPPAPIPPSALRYRPVGPPSGSAGPAGRAYRRLRRIFPD